jgi:PAS domain S-box-containing protein
MRPNPVIDIGNIDSSVAVVLCDASFPDMPVVYCSEPFERLTGYSSSEILGRNCRFLRHPHRRQLPSDIEGGNLEQMVQDLNAEARITLKHSFEKDGEARVRLVNYMKSGAKFANLLTTIPITWDEGEASNGTGKRYIVGFQADSHELVGF